MTTVLVSEYHYHNDYTKRHILMTIRNESIKSLYEMNQSNHYTK
jgi:hypothetical protein